MSGNVHQTILLQFIGYKEEVLFFTSRGTPVLVKLILLPKVIAQTQASGNENPLIEGIQEYSFLADIQFYHINALFKLFNYKTNNMKRWSKDKR
jgi:hypothetical protein